jgi:hypothetical protein
MITFLLTLIWVMPGPEDVKPEITQIEVPAISIDDCLKAGNGHAQEIWDKHDHKGSIRYICFAKGP